MRKLGTVDIAMYFRAFPMLFRHLSILAVPLLAAVIDVLFDRLQTLFTDPLGGGGAGIFAMLSQLVYLFIGDIAGLALGAIAAFFLIYTIPAAAIGGMPGSLALAASFRAVRESVLGSIVLAVVFFAVYYIAVPYALPFLLVHLPPLGGQLVMALARALALGYLAFPFAKQYDDAAFRRSW
jgi:hypothetical protein